MSKRPLSDGEVSDQKKKRTAKEPKPLDPKKFGGKTEEEVCQMLLPDHLAPDLDIIFMGINPGLYSAYLGHHYCNANNHFWPCLYESGLIPKKLSFMQDAEVLNYGIGMSNIVPRTTRSAAELSRKEIKEWSKVMIERMQELKPLIICFNGKGIYEIYTGGKCTVGIQEDPLPGTDVVVYVMPSTSGRAATYPKRSDKLVFFNELKSLRDRLRRERRKQTDLTSEVAEDSTFAANSSIEGRNNDREQERLEIDSCGTVAQRKSVIVALENPGQSDHLKSDLTSNPAVTTNLNSGVTDDVKPSNQPIVVTSPYFHKQIQ